MGIEPTQPAWEAGTLPLSYTRVNYLFVLFYYNVKNHKNQDIS